MEETSNCMALDSISFDSSQLRVRRPNDYNQPAAMKLGPVVPNIKMNLEAIGLSNDALQRMQSGVASGQNNVIQTDPTSSTQTKIEYLSEAYHIS